MEPNECTLVEITTALKNAMSLGDLDVIADRVADLEHHISGSVNKGEIQEEMTLADLNEWMLRVTSDNCFYGCSQYKTMRCLNYVVSGEYLDKAFQALPDADKAQANKLGEAVRDWYDKWMEAYLALPVIKDEQDN